MDLMVSRVFASTNDARNRGDRFGARNSGFESAYAHRPGFGDSYDVPPGGGCFEWLEWSVDTSNLPGKLVNCTG